MRFGWLFWIFIVLLTVGVLQKNIETIPDQLHMATGQVHIDGEYACNAFKIKDKVFLTAAHCVPSLYRERLAIVYGEAVRKVQVAIRVAPDISLLTIRNPFYNVQHVTLGCDVPLSYGRKVAMLGSSIIHERMYLTGAIAAITEMKFDTFLVDILGAPGLSGAPVMDVKSEKVIGVFTAVIWYNSTMYDRNVVLGGVQGIKIEALCG